MQLIILGMHRSGTSVLARLLNMMGAYFGPEGISTGASKENPKGFWERRDVRLLNDFVLNSAGCDWNRVVDFDIAALPEPVITEFRGKAAKIVLEMDSHRPWLLKEPRLCLLFNLWKELLEVPVCIHIYRNPLEVAQSLYKRNGIPTHTGIALWEKYNLSALAASRGLPRLAVSHNKLMKDPVAEVEYIHEILLDCGVSELRLPLNNEITSFVRKDLYREKVADKELPQFLNANQTRIFNGFKNGQILKRRNIFTLSKAATHTLRQYEQLEEKEKELILQLRRKEKDAMDSLNVAGKAESELRRHIKHKELEAINSQTAASKMETQLRKQFKQQEDDLIQQLNQKELEKKRILDAAGKVETDLRQHLKQKEQEVTNYHTAAGKLEAELRKQLEQQEKHLIQRLNQRELETKELMDTAGKMEADLRSLLEQKDIELTQQLHQKTRAAENALEAANIKETESRNLLDKKELQLAHVKQAIAGIGEYIASQDEIIKQLFRRIDSITSTRRWSIGSAFFSLKHRLLTGKPPNKAIDYFNNLREKYGILKTKDDLMRHHLQELLKPVLEDVIPAKPRNKEKNKKKAPYTPLPDSQLRQRIQEFKASNVRKKVVVYTAVVGKYDVIKVPEALNPEYDYVCFTDIPVPDHPVWQFRPTTYFNADTTRIARYYKLHPHIYLKEYDVAVWVDANILIREDINYLVDTFLQGDKPLGIFTHYQRNCTYSEAKACIDSNKDEGDIIKEQIKRYSQEGLSENIGLPETNILISKPNDPESRQIFSHWWKELDNGSKRDQIAVMYALWKNGTDFTPLVESTQKMARFNREHFELFLHHDGTSFSHPSTYHVPSFLQQQYMSASKMWWELLHPAEITDSILWEYRAKTVDIIIPVHNALADVKRCLNSVEPALLDTHHLIIVDDGSKDDTKTFLQEFAAKRTSYVSLIRHEAAKGYTKAANAGMRSSASSYVILLNSDTVVAASWVLKLVHCAESSKEIGIVGPLSNAASWQSIPEIKEQDGSYSLNPLPTGITVQDMDLMCQKLTLPEFPRVQLVNGFCFCIKRAVIDRIGLFDEASYPKGYNEENDYCFRATDAGFELSIATHTYVYHAKSKSYTPKKRLLLCKESRKVFENTYGLHRINRATESVRNHPLINETRSAIKKELTHV